MNCFHFYIFDISETVRQFSFNTTTLLWIAFIFISLTYQKQLRIKIPPTDNVVNCFHFYIFDISETVGGIATKVHLSCELLSFLYLWHIRNSLFSFWYIYRNVVNCFHFYIFDISETVHVVVDMVVTSCELLSFLYLWHIRNS